MIINFLKWILFWIANLIPGFSWATMAIILWIYEKIIKSISWLTNIKEFKKSFLFLSIIWTWAILWVFLFATIFGFLLERQETQVQVVFMWIVLWSLPAIFENTRWEKIKIKNILLSIIAAILVVSLIISQNINFWINYSTLAIEYIKLFFSWFIAAWAMIIPWFSGSLMLIILWEYQNILWYVSNFMIEKIIIVWLWAVIWILTLAKIISKILDKSKTSFYYFIYWLIIASLISIFPKDFFVNIVLNIIILILTTIAVFFLSKKVDSR